MTVRNNVAVLFVVTAFAVRTAEAVTTNLIADNYLVRTRIVRIKRIDADFQKGESALIRPIRGIRVLFVSTT